MVFNLKIVCFDCVYITITSMKSWLLDVSLISNRRYSPNQTDNQSGMILNQNRSYRILKIQYKNNCTYKTMHIVTYKTFIHVRWMLYRSCVVTYKCIKHNLQEHVYTTRNLLQHVFTATLLVWRWWHSNRVRCACGQAGPGGDLRHPEELPVLSARAGIQHGRGRDHEWTCLLHTGWAMFTCMTSVNSSSVLQFTTNII